MAQALAADESLVKGNLTGFLHGLPIAVKDLIETKGIRTTYGSPLWKDFIPLQDALIAERERHCYRKNKCAGVRDGVADF